MMQKIQNNWWQTDFNQNFFKIYYNYLNPKIDAFIFQMVKFAGLKPSDYIFDLACGNGGHLESLYRQGFKHLFGADYNYYKEAANKLKKYRIKVVKLDMRQALPAKNFDAVLLNSTSFGYFNESDNKKVLRNIHKALAPGGKIFIDNLSHEFISKNFQPKNWTRFSKNVFFLEERIFSEDRKYLSSEWTLIEKDKINVLRNRLRLYSTTEYRKILKDAGFDKIKISPKGAHIWVTATKTKQIHLG